jgi:hypothetical protein
VTLTVRSGLETIMGRMVLGLLKDPRANVIGLI